MSDGDQKLIDALQENNKDLRNQIEELKKQLEEAKKQQSSSSGGGQPAQSSQPVEKQAVRLTASGTKGKIGSLAGGQGLARLLDRDGEPIEGETIVFSVDGREVGTGTTDANGEAVIQSGQYAGDPQMWVQALGNGYTAIYNGSKKYKPAKANAQIGVGIV
ncbi:Ig-like domain-containing protein [Streptomyces sp. BHT-5-2]|uniref:Ig-like domain-containing protein n=1 Tax=unclassified Streptomyces TaxID=2593676 RepID=UPI001C8E7AE9|nr:Ig-like domain-containing protein [Streptomyces sp. BHT-5-2]QZL04344.1 Ig-like domain-containing protein [Streptomyces sp. BHT-5-2]